MKRKQSTYLLIVVLWCVLIFWFSAQDGTSSSSLSDQILYWISDFIHVDLMQMDIVHWLQLAIRKSAHAFVYFMLAIWFYLFLRHSKWNNHARAFAILGCFLYACSDEFHQLFIPGRAGLFQDVLIDTTGAVLAMMLFPWLYWRIYNDHVNSFGQIDKDIC